MKSLFPLSVILDYISISSHKNTVMRTNKTIEEPVKSIEKIENVVDKVSANKVNRTQLRDLPPLTKVQWETWLHNNSLKMKIASVQLNFISGLSSSSANN